MTNIIGISGHIGSGKDEVGKIIQYLTSNKKDISYSGSYNSYIMDIGIGINITSKWKIKKFGGKLKQVASILTGIPIKRFEDQEFKKTCLGEEWNYDKILPRDDMLQMNKCWETVPMTVREFLQKLGTEGLREGLHQNVWVNALFADYNNDYYDWKNGGKQDSYPNWIITDVRFPNEAKAVKERRGILIRVNRYIPLEMYHTGENGEMVSNPENSIMKHPSETSLDDWEFDYVIDNNGTIEELIIKVKDLLEKLP